MNDVMLSDDDNNDDDDESNALYVKLSVIGDAEKPSLMY